MEPTRGTLATVTCRECGRQPGPGELWRLLFADIGEAVTYCPGCAEREFGQQETGPG
jgi:NAD-dependent SIR2 family protein deacetylase